LNERIAGFLIDECLSQELAHQAQEHDYLALAANRMWRLRRRDDYRVARYALDRDLILVTNDQYDFAAIYQQFEIHPGIVFITAGRSKLRELRYQQAMFAMALDEIEEREPINTAILLTAHEGKGRRVQLNIRTYAFPSEN
jgi:predicted nuclease of predicted toxin-antitoxin system